ncbi:MAG: beta-phosphoglucomutase [Chitinophagales bacterium]
MIEGCIFDLDGVIVDTAKYHFQAWRRLANEKFGFDFDAQKNEELKGVSRLGSLDLIIGWGNEEHGLNLNFTEKEKMELATIKNEWYKALIITMTADEILPGVMDFIHELQGYNIKLGIGSASKNTPTVLEVIGIAHYFESIVDGQKCTISKPEPDVFLMGASELGIDPHNSIVFEDAASGVEAALRGGFHAVGVGSPSHLGHADCVIEGFEGLNFEGLKQKLGIE